MAVISPQKIWPDARVPYVAETPEIDGWLREINAAVGFPLLVPKGKSDSDYISAERGAGKSETIGYRKEKGKHKITAGNKFSMQHELLHALGFHHEQLHRDGPWGAFGTKATKVDRIDKGLLERWGANMVPEDSRVLVPQAAPKKPAVLEDVPKKKTEAEPEGRGRRKSITSGEKVLLKVNQEAIEQHKRAYQEVLDDTNIVCYQSCDFDSVMMYGEMREAARIFQDKMKSTGKHSKAPCLSNGDVDALKHLYECKILVVYRPPAQFFA